MKTKSALIEESKQHYYDHPESMVDDLRKFVIEWNKSGSNLHDNLVLRAAWCSAFLALADIWEKGLAERDAK